MHSEDIKANRKATIKTGQSGVYNEGKKIEWGDDYKIPKREV